VDYDDSRDDLDAVHIESIVLLDVLDGQPDPLGSETDRAVEDLDAIAGGRGGRTGSRLWGG
jgi:hypothetical protein